MERDGFVKVTKKKCYKKKYAKSPNADSSIGNVDVNKITRCVRSAHVISLILEPILFNSDSRQ